MASLDEVCEFLNTKQKMHKEELVEQMYVVLENKLGRIKTEVTYVRAIAEEALAASNRNHESVDYNQSKIDELEEKYKEIKDDLHDCVNRSMNNLLMVKKMSSNNNKNNKKRDDSISPDSGQPEEDEDDEPDVKESSKLDHLFQSDCPITKGKVEGLIKIRNDSNPIRNRRKKTRTSSMKAKYEKGCVIESCSDQPRAKGLKGDQPRAKALKRMAMLARKKIKKERAIVDGNCILYPNVFKVSLPVISSIKMKHYLFSLTTLL